jgi:hypothetical protein
MALFATSSVYTYASLEGCHEQPQRALPGFSRFLVRRRAGHGMAGAWVDSTDDKPAAAEGFAPDEQETAAPTAAAVRHNQAMCARLDDLMGKGLSYAERGKTAETRAALHCPPTSHATQAAEGTRTK